MDTHATTPLDPRVLEVMIPYFLNEYGNAASIDHLYGVSAKKAVDNARLTISKIIGGRRDSEIIFTSGATESNNLAVIGAYRHYKNKGQHIISTVIEHPCILNSLRYLKENEGAEISLLPVDQYGQISLDELQKTIRKDTILISVMFANNEIGTIQPIKEIGTIAKTHGIIFHSDAAQAMGYEKINVYDMNIDLMSFSAHKFYGPKGVGGLFVRSFNPMIRLDPILHGGGQERGFRSGTINVPGVVGMAEALKLADSEWKTNHDRIRNLRDRLYDSLKAKFPDIRFNGHPQNRLVHNLNITIPGIEAKALIHALRGKLSFSAGSACSTMKATPSYVLLAIGMAEKETFQTIRLGLGRNLENTDFESISDLLCQALESKNTTR